MSSNYRHHTGNGNGNGNIGCNGNVFSSLSLRLTGVPSTSTANGNHGNKNNKVNLQQDRSARCLPSPLPSSSPSTTENYKGNHDDINTELPSLSLRPGQEEQGRRRPTFKTSYLPLLAFTVFALLMTGTAPIKTAEARTAAASSTSSSSSSKLSGLFGRRSEIGASSGTPQPLSPLAMAKPSSSSAVSLLHQWGNLGYKPQTIPLQDIWKDKLRRFVTTTIIEKIRDEFKLLRTRLLTTNLAMRLARTWVFWFFSKDCLSSIYEDKWHAERDPDAFFGNDGMWISTGAHKDVVRKRMQRSKRNRQWVGLGYTPR